MLKHILRVIVKRSARNILLVVGLLALSSGLSTYVSANQNAAIKVNSALDEHWRGAYDILVRPQDSVQPTEKQYGVVESNYLSVGKSGISVEQWKQIQGLTGVEVAAPVATIGYLRGTTSAMDVEVPPQQNDSLLRLSVDISSTNGFRAVDLVNLQHYFLIPSSAKLSAAKRPTIPINTSIGDIQYPVLGNWSQVGEGGSQRISRDGHVVLSVLQMPLIWTLVAGIDPASEAKLTGLDKAVVSGKYLADNDGYKLDQGTNPLYGDRAGTAIPVIRMDASYVSLPSSIKIDRLAMLNNEELQQAVSLGSLYLPTGNNRGKNQRAQVGYLSSLNKPVTETLFNQGLDFGSIIRPMTIEPLLISLYKDRPQIQTDPSGYEFNGAGLDRTYLPGAIHYQDNKPPFDAKKELTLSAEPIASAQTIISTTGEAAFRSLPEQAATGGNDFFDAGVGTYSLDKLPASVRNPDPLTYVPLGIYQPPLTQLVRDAQGNPLPQGPVTLHPTLNPASFIPGPPLALTNIAAARFFRGDNCIDAIRVRVAGIDRYTPENIKKVEDIAAQIIKSTGLHVDIVAGSSPQPVLVYIPGSPDGKVAPLGYVQEQWTTLGAAASISSGIDTASVLMLGATGIAGLLYLVSQSLLSTLSRRREFALLQAVGWRRRHIEELIVGEAGILGLLGGVCAALLAVVIAQALGLVAPPEQAAGVGAVVFLLYVLASIGPAMWVTRQPVAELLQRGEIALPTRDTHAAGEQTSLESEESSSLNRRGERVKRLGGAGLSALAVFAWRNLSRRRVRSLLAIAGVSIATTLLMLLSASLVALSGTLRVTLLGQFVGLQVQPYHFIMVGSALVISILTVADHLAVGVLERRHELALLQAVGWRKGAVRLSLLLEGVWLGLIGGLIGAVIAIGVGLASRSEAVLSAWWVVPVGLVVMLGLCSLSALYAIFLTPSRALVRAMQQ